MGNGNKFKFSNVIPNVLSKIGVGPRKISGRAKGSDSSSIALTEACDHHLDQNVHRFGNRKNGDYRSASPSSRNNRNKATRQSLSPVLVGGGHQRTFDIRFPAESPVRSKGSESRSHSPPPQYLARTIQNSAAHSDPGCGSFDSSTLALVPHVDGRQRREFSPVFGRCSIMSKCNSFRGSTHSDSEISETETTSSRAQSQSRRRLRHSRTKSVHLGNSSRHTTCCEFEGCCYDSMAPSAEGAGGAACIQVQQQDGISSLRRGSNFRQQRRDQTPSIVDRSSHEQLYGGSSPIHPGGAGAETRLMYNSNNSPAAAAAATYYSASAIPEKGGSRECLDSPVTGKGGGIRNDPRSRSRERSTRSDHHHHWQRHVQTPSDALQFQERGLNRKLSFATSGSEKAGGNHGHFDVDASFSSEDEGSAYYVRGSSKDCNNAKISLSSRSQLRPSTTGSNHNVKSQQRSASAYSRMENADQAGFISREVVLELEGDDLRDSTQIRYQVHDEDEATFQRERILAKTVLDASDGWARRQLSRFSQDERRGRASDYDELHRPAHNADLEATTIFPAAAAPQGHNKANKDGTVGTWAEESLLAIVKLDDSKLVPVGSRVVSLAKLRDNDRGHHPRIVFKKDVEEDYDDYATKDDEKTVGHPPIRTFRSPPHSSRDFSSLKSPKTPSPIGEVEKRTEGRIAYKSNFSPTKNDRGGNFVYNKPKLPSSMFSDEELSSRAGGVAKCGSGPAGGGRTFESARLDTDEKEIGLPWEADYPSFRSDSMVLGAAEGKMGSGRVMPEERVAAQVDLLELLDSKVPPPRTPRNVERQRQSKIGGLGYQDQDISTTKGSGKNSIRSKSPASREDVIKAGLKSFRTANQSRSPSRRSMPELSNSASTRQGRVSSTGSPCSTQENSSIGRKLPNRSPSPVKDTNSNSKRFSNRSPMRLNGHAQGQGQGQVQNNNNVNQAASTPTLQTPVNFRSGFSNKPGRRTQSPARDESPARDQSPTPRPKKPLSARAEAGMQRLDSVAVVKASYDPYHDFRESMVEMILENDIRTARDLEDLLQCYLSLNSPDYHKVIVQVFTDIWGDIFDQ